MGVSAVKSKPKAKRKPAPPGPVRSEAQLREALAKIDRDDRLYEKFADMEINAPLAIIQVQLAAQRRLLRWALGED